ncbi:MAG: hypothetical protein KF699_08210 [Phycisphaeraceae bacterium]|nr:hypothetical protein [Phycisphaeraceae bacterium]MBX3406213.1 hypothetical protein [Phycisphaeraceae bacterium]
MLTTLAQSSLSGGAARAIAEELPKPEGPTQTILWAILGVVLIAIVFGFVIKMKMDGER